MNLLNLLRPRPSAMIARDRLQILLAHERGARGQPDLVAVLREEILGVIGKHCTVDDDSVRIAMDRGDGFSMLEIEVEIPNPGPAAPEAAAEA